MSKTTIALCIGTLLIAIPASAEIFLWTDDSGVTRYTNQVASVPVDVRGRVDRLESHVDLIQRTDRSTLRDALMRRRVGRVIEVPFQRDGELLRVEVRLNDSVLVPFYLDTAATGVSIPSSVARALGVSREATLRTTTALTAGGPASFGVIGIESLDLAGARLDNFEGTVNPHIDVGLLGGSFLNQFNYMVDTERGVILFEPAGRDRARAAR